MSKKSSKTTLNKRILYIAVPICIAAVIIAVTVIGIQTSLTANTVVAEIDGMKIYAGEIKLQMDNKKSSVVEHFEELGLEYDGDFWNKEYSSTTPEQYLKQEALREIVQYKYELRQGVKYGLIDDMSYKALVREATSINNENSEKIKNGEAVYGQKEYTLSTYYEYRLSNLRLDLQKLMSEKGEPLYATNEDLLKYYEEYKQISFKNADKAVFEVLTLDVFGEDISDAEQALTAAGNIIKQYDDFDKAKAEIAQKYPEIKFNTVQFNKDTASSLAKQDSELYAVLEDMQAGDISEISRTATSARIIYCQSRIKDGYQSFDEVKSTVKTQYAQSEYYKYILKMTEGKTAKINDKFERIHIDTKM